MSHRSHKLRDSRRPGLERESSFALVELPWGNDRIDKGEIADGIVQRLLAMGINPTASHIDRSKIESIVLEDYPGVYVRPTPEAMDDAVLRTADNGTGLLFAAGQWIEYQGLDQEWHLGLVRRVVASAPIDYDPLSVAEPNWVYTYNVGKQLTIPPFLTRAPEEGLKRVFGMRPWVFQQWCVLRVMNLVRFAEEHQRDFEVMNFVLQAELIWINWLDHPSNADFKALYDAQPQGARTKLVQHILSPFASIERLSKLNKPGDRWDFATQNISIYTYASVLGSGWVTCLLVLMIQILIPLLLLNSSVELQRDSSNPNILGDFPDYYAPWSVFCHSQSPRALEGMFMNLLVVTFYALRVAPRVFDEFFQTVGEGDTPASRLNSLRSILWEQNSDGAVRQVGFRLERYMKSLYPVFINVLMLFVLFITDNAVDIVLNALAVEFVQTFDIELARSKWFDPKRRWIKAGAVEMRMDATLRHAALKSASVFCSTFGISLDDYCAAIGGNLPLESASDAKRDGEDPRFMTLQDKVWHVAADVALEHHRSIAQWQFCENGANFGFLDNFLASTLTARGMKWGIFKRRFSYMSWSRWEQILFLAPVPPKKTGFQSRLLASRRDEQDSSLIVREEASVPHVNAAVGVVHELRQRLFKIGHGPDYLNFKIDAFLTPGQRFQREIMDIFMLKYMFKSIKIGLLSGNPLSVIFRIGDGLLEIASVFMQIFFPVVLCLFLLLNAACY